MPDYPLIEGEAEDLFRSLRMSPSDDSEGFIELFTITPPYLTQYHLITHSPYPDSPVYYYRLKDGNQHTILDFLYSSPDYTWTEEQRLRIEAGYDAGQYIQLTLTHYNRKKVLTDVNLFYLPR